MSNKRNLKKRVRYMCGDMAAECIIAKSVIPGADAKALAEIVIKIAYLQEATLGKISFSYDKTPSDFDSAKAYNKARAAYMAKAYRSLKAEFNNQVASIVKEMNAAVPHSTNKGE
ncbi:MAG: hypothetical protein NC082_01235 [Clostridiales bacterium]|nr:hypothetical protein [Clostridiales bacterium]